MKNKNKFYKLIKLTFILLLIAGCETTDINLTENNNLLQNDQANPDLLLNGAQVNFAKAIQEFGEAAAEVSRLKNMSGRNYQNVYGATFFDDAWENSYVGTINNLRIMNKIAIQKNLKKHIAMGQVIEAYMMITLVDLFGKVPYSEAFDINNLTPKLDDEKEIYTKSIALLDQSIANFTVVSTTLPTNDFYYNKDWTKWIKLANSIKMKVYLQSRLVDTDAISKFNAIAATNNIIGIGEDFQFNWSTSNTNPDSRHPLFVDNYGPAGVDLGYQSNWLMDYMKNSKTVSDPRMRYYFYRQVSSVPVNEQDIRCSVEPAPSHYLIGNFTYCIIANSQGYWGRDHGNNEGIPNDRQKRTAIGVYPGGGKFDGDNFATISGAGALSLGAKGSGITPILLSSSLDFMKAEAALFGGSGVAKNHLVSGIQKSLAKVRGFISRDATANLTFVPAISVDTQYINEVETKFDAATDNTAKLNVIIPEFLVSLFGNGIDAYNAYRRTGAPTNIQPNLELNPGGFIRSFLYPASETGTNPNVIQKNSVTQKVFWDNNASTGFPVGN
jgi:Starch-binding associating with outer membrane